jgi:apolipoprotein N-acyltransferase
MNRTEQGRKRDRRDATRGSRPRIWPAQVGLLALSVLLLSLALAPIDRFYLAWVGLAPWMLAVSRAASKKSAFAWGFAGGWAFFLANMWWLWFVSIPGMFALTLYLAIFWGACAIVVRGLFLSPLPPGEGWGEGALATDVSRLPSPPHPNPLPGGEGTRSPLLIILFIATVWTAFEWLRGNVSFLGKQGLPWLYLGQTQSPLLVMCQIADVTSVLGVTFWVTMVNVLIVVLYLNRAQLRRTIPAAVTVAAILIAIGVYGAFRMSQPTQSAGPTVLVVQSNYKQSNTGEKGAPVSEIVDFHVRTTRAALQELTSRGQLVDLVVWSETMMPPLNDSAIEQARGSRQGELWRRARDEVARIATEFHTAMLVGGIMHDDWQVRGEYVLPQDRRNTAYFFDRGGRLSEARYDKVHLVPFGEYIPFKESIPPLYRLFIKLGPNYYEEYALTRGSKLTVFELTRNDANSATDPYRFVAPICFEDIVPSMVGRMLHEPGSGATRRADFLVNITNDGWFRAGQMPQHLQAAVFRSIEHRVATARSVNTGVSGFVDPLGRVSGTVPAETEGWRAQTLLLDRRVTPYTRVGDAFPITCLALTAAVCVAGIVRNRRNTSVRSQTES